MSYLRFLGMWVTVYAVLRGTVGKPRQNTSASNTHTHNSMNPVSTSISKLFRIFHAQTSCLFQDANTNADAQAVWWKSLSLSFGSWSDFAFFMSCKVLVLQEDLIIFCRFLDTVHMLILYKSVFNSGTALILLVIILTFLLIPLSF